MTVRQYKTPTVVYQFQIRNQPVRAATFLGHAESLLTYYLSFSWLRCCDILGGYVIRADGDVVMGTTDEVSMSETWLPAIMQLQRGEKSAFPWPFEESNMTLTRTRDLVTLVEVHSSGHVVCPMVQFKFEEFVAAMLNASRPLATLFTQFQAARETHLAAAHAVGNEEMIEKLQVLADEVSASWPRRIAECAQLYGDACSSARFHSAPHKS